MAIFTDNVLCLAVLTLACFLKLSMALLMPEHGNYGIELFQLVKFHFSWTLFSLSTILFHHPKK
jgi:hypothetical protein